MDFSSSKILSELIDEENTCEIRHTACKQATVLMSKYRPSKNQLEW